MGYLLINLLFIDFYLFIYPLFIKLVTPSPCYLKDPVDGQEKWSKMASFLKHFPLVIPIEICFVGVYFAGIFVSVW